LSSGTASAHPYSIGINGGTLWYSVPTGASHNWFVNGTATMSLSSTNLITSGDITAFGSVSDERLKEQVLALPSLESKTIIDQMRPVKYKWKSEVFNHEYRGKDDIGFIAQEIEELIPEAVKSVMIQGEEYKTIKYERILPILVGAIQTLSREVKELKEKMNM